MKRLIAVISAVLMLTSCSPVASKKVAAQGKVISCSEIRVDSNVTKGTRVPCIDGGSGIVMESLRGPAIVNVWGSWCAPCVAELPHLVALAQKKKINIIGVDVEEKSQAAGKAFMISHGITWPVLYDPDGRTKTLYGLGVPVTFFITSKGEVAYRHIGIINSDQILFDEVKKYLGIQL